jgi:hypothetical protein
MEEQKIKAFIGKILLFREFGFSGIPRKVNQEFTKEFFASLTAQGVSPARVEQYCEQMQRG